MPTDPTGNGQLVPKAGDRFRWVGLEGQSDPEAVIIVDSLAATCSVNARLEKLGGGNSIGLIGIGAADLLAAIHAGWLVPDA